MKLSFLFIDLTDNSSKNNVTMYSIICVRMYAYITEMNDISKGRAEIGICYYYYKVCLYRAIV